MLRNAKILDKRQERCHPLRTGCDPNPGVLCLGNLTSTFVDFSDKNSGMNWEYFHVIWWTKLCRFLVCLVFVFFFYYCMNMQGKLHPGIALNNNYFVHTSQSFLNSRVICVGDNYSLVQSHLVLWGRCTKFPHQLLQPSLGILKGSLNMKML